MVDGIRIDELDPALAANGEHAFPVMRNGVTELLLISQVATLILDLIRNGAPAALDTLDELSAALGDDANFAATLATTIAGINTIVGGHTTTLGTHNTRITANENALPGKQPLDAMLTALAALTSSNGKFLAFSGADAPVLRDIIGTVSQAAGVPTGAIMETGGTSSATYIRFANGIQICVCQGNIAVAANTAFTDIGPVAYPAAFANSSPLTYACLQGNYGNQAGTASSLGGSATSWSARLSNTASPPVNAASGASYVNFLAIGRWF